MLSWRFYGGVDFLKLINEYIVWDKNPDAGTPANAGAGVGMGQLQLRINSSFEAQSRGYCAVHVPPRPRLVALTKFHLDEYHRAHWKSLHFWIILVVVKQHLVHIGRIDGPTEYLSQILAAIKLVGQGSFPL